MVTNPVSTYLINLGNKDIQTAESYICIGHETKISSTSSINSKDNETTKFSRRAMDGMDFVW